jgi:hypothetical protein
VGSIWDSEGHLRDDMSDREVAHKAWNWVAIVVAVGLVLSFGVWALGIVTAPWVGRQNVHRQINSPANQIFQYEHFFTLNGDIAADAANLKTEEAQAAAHAQAYPPGSPDPIGANAAEQSRLESVVTGTSALCQSLVQQYNNDAKEYTKDTFLSHQLPNQEDPTQCEVK